MAHPANGIKPLVTNAASEEQAKAAKERIESREARLRRAMANLLATEDGQIVMWEMLSYCRVFGSIWESSAKIHYNSGQQDVGHYLLAKITEARPDVLVKMMQDQATK